MSSSSRMARLVLTAAVVVLFAAAGCASWLPASTPIRTATTRAQDDTIGQCLLVFLPGFGDSEEDFADHGFPQALRARNLPIDTISVNATFGYYARRTVLERVRVDVLDPARAAGYTKIWLAGISMGGLGVQLVARDEQLRGRPIEGIILIAPYLGEEKVQKEVVAAGGVAKWTPTPATGPDDYDHDLWRWLKTVTEKPDGAPTLYLAAGDKDKLGAGHRLLAAALPDNRVFRTPGGHDWGPWSVLWADFLDHSDFRARCRQR